MPMQRPAAAAGGRRPRRGKSEFRGDMRNCFDEAGGRARGTVARRQGARHWRFVSLPPCVSHPLRKQTPTDSTLPVDPAVTVGTLPNGLRYYIRVNHRPAKRAELRLVVNAGSVLEDDDQRGLAHFAEHMAFNGTTHFKKQELVDYIESIGMRFGADLNAGTSFDETVYELQVPTDSAHIVRKAFEILEDWAHGVTFDTTEIRKERGVVLEEWRLGRGAGQRMFDQQLPVLFRGSRYAERLPIGTPECIRQCPPPWCAGFTRLVSSRPDGGRRGRRFRRRRDRRPDQAAVLEHSAPDRAPGGRCRRCRRIRLRR